MIHPHPRHCTIALLRAVNTYPPEKLALMKPSRIKAARSNNWLDAGLNLTEEGKADFKALGLTPLPQ